MVGVLPTRMWRSGTVVIGDDVQMPIRRDEVRSASQASTPQGLQGSRPPIFDLQGSFCVDDLQYFEKCFIFFPSAELLNTASRCHFHLQYAHCTVFNSTVEQNSL